jgi:RNA polymerase sigma-70 factor (TIGR02957 family)
MSDDDPFVRHRGLLFTVAYEMLGSAADAEDVVQEAWLRWAGLGDAARGEVHDPRTYLVRVVTRQALNRLRTVARRREDYIGPWLPEPLLTSPDVAEDIELAESVSIAMLTVLETLLPAERAVFVLREVFDLSYEEIAGAVGKTESAVRQIVHRARRHVAARRPRSRVSRTEQREVVERFLEALSNGDVQGLMDVLAPDVVLVSDGGGLAGAARKPITGAERLVRFLTSQGARDVVGAAAWLNGAPGFLLLGDDQVVAAIGLAVENGQITRLYAVANPDKLAGLETETALTRQIRGSGS